MMWRLLVIFWCVCMCWFSFLFCGRGRVWSWWFCSYGSYYTLLFVISASDDFCLLCRIHMAPFSDEYLFVEIANKVSKCYRSLIRYKQLGWFCCLSFLLLFYLLIYCWVCIYYIWGSTMVSDNFSNFPVSHFIGQ